MNLILCMIFLRSFSNGIDRIYGSNISLVLSVTIIIVSAIYLPYLWKSIPVKVLPILAFLSLFICISILSLVVGITVTDTILDVDAGVYSIFRYIYWLSMVGLICSVYCRPDFVDKVHRLYLALLLVTVSIGIVQHLTGNVVRIDNDKFDRVAGLSSHPVVYSIEVVLIFCVTELSRIKLRKRLSYIYMFSYSLLAVALVFSMSRTGISILAITLAIYVAIVRPWMLAILSAIFIVLIALTPFQGLFSTLLSVPDYILSGDYQVWDYRTGETSVHWRIYHWYYLLSHAWEFPFLGHGPGQTTLYSPFRLEAHSMFVEVFFECGLYGLLAFGLFWFSIPRALSRDRKRVEVRKSPDTAARRLAFALFVSVTIMGFFDQSFNIEVVEFSHLIIGMFVALSPVVNVNPAAARILSAFQSRRMGLALTSAVRAGLRIR